MGCNGFRGLLNEFRGTFNYPTVIQYIKSWYFIGFVPGGCTPRLFILKPNRLLPTPGMYSVRREEHRTVLNTNTVGAVSFF